MAKLAMLLQKHTSQTLNEDAQGAVDARKKVKVTISDHEGIRQRSSESNIGKGGQKAQLQNIERIQTQMSDKASKLATATTNEPMNPMAPLALDVGSRVLKESSGGVVHPSVHTAPLPTYRESLENSRFGFNSSFEEKSIMSHRQLLHSSTLDAPLTASDKYSGPLPLVSAAARHAPHPTLIPDPLLAVVLLHPLVVAPSHHPPAVDPQRHHLGVALYLEELNQQSCYSFDTAPEHPPFYRTDSVEDGSKDAHMDDKSSVNIDKISPDEDEREAEKGLRGPNARHIPDDCDIDPVLLAEEQHHSHSDNHARRIPENHIAGELCHV
ncbi:hypothetical protein JVU11DRAFT_2259 [Chiua virens]|nr:hypothetical protein JVU11DRAFT_2259 [Chiua virens]